MTSHHLNGLIIHADKAWNNGNSPTGLAIAVHLHKLGKSTPSHIVHADNVTCEECSA